MIKQNIKTKFLKIYSEKFDLESLMAFYDECIVLKKNPKTEIEIIERWLEKFNRPTNSISSFELRNFLIKRQQRIQNLKKSGKHQSIIDQSLFDIYATNQEDSIKAFQEYVKLKTRHSIFLHNEKNRYGSKENYEKKHGSLDGFRSTARYNSNTNIEYWLKQGLTIEEARTRLRERQSTFTLEKCIEKYRKRRGGLKIYKKAR